MEVDNKIMMAIGIVVLTIFLLSLTGTIVSQVDVVVTAGTAAGATHWNFTGADGALTIMGLIPFIWVAAVLMAAVVGMWTIARGHSGG